MKIILFYFITTGFIFSTNAQVLIGRAHLYNGPSASVYNLKRATLMAAQSDDKKASNPEALKKAQDEFSAAKLPSKWKPVAGAFSFPFKYRPQSGIMETNFSLSLVGGFEYNSDPTNDSTHHLWSGYIGIGQSSISLNSNNSSVSSNTTRNAVAISFTLLYEWQGLQFAVSSGIDENLDNSTDKWHYQSKPWITAGIGFSIFTQSKK